MMSNPPGILRWVVLLSIVCAVSVSYAIKYHSIAAACVATAGFVLFGVCLIVLHYYTRTLKQMRRRDDALLDSWPKELGVIMSSESLDDRIKATRDIRKWASYPNYPFKRDAVRILRDLIKTKDEKPSLIGSAIDTLSEFKDPQDTEFFAEIAKSSAPVWAYVRRSAIAALRNAPNGEKYLKDLIETHREGESQFQAISALIRSRDNGDVNKLKERAAFLDHCAQQDPSPERQRDILKAKEKLVGVGASR